MFDFYSETKQYIVTQSGYTQLLVGSKPEKSTPEGCMNACVQASGLPGAFLAYPEARSGFKRAHQR